MKSSIIYIANQFKIQNLPFIILLLFSAKVNAQSNIDTVLSFISKNNKTILANTQYWEAQKLGYKTGLTPYNPTVNYDYMSGSPAIAGNQTNFTITQSFDFPTAYIKKKQLSEQKITQAAFQLTVTRQDILLESKKVCIDLVYRNKLQLQLAERKNNTEKLLSDFQARLDKGEGNILDVNKAQLQLIEINAAFQENISSINQVNQKLTELNGGNAIAFTDTIYPPLPDIPAFEQLKTEIENRDPIRKLLEQEKIVMRKQVELSKAMLLPKLETGYRYQGILGQKFRGIYASITIPLWENKNTVKTQQAKLLYTDLELQNYRNERYFAIKQFYEKYANLKITLQQYQTIFATLNYIVLLNKSLSLGQISTIEYFLELSYYYNVFNNYLETEKQYYEVVAELFKYQL